MKSAADVISSVFLSSKIYDVSLEVAARRLAERYSNINLLCGMPKKNKLLEAVIEVYWTTGPILGETLNRRKHLKLTTPIGKLLAPFLTEGAPKGTFDKVREQDLFLYRLLSGAVLMAVVKSETDMRGENCRATS